MLPIMVAENMRPGRSPRKLMGFSENREVNKNNLLGGQFLIFLPKNPGK